MQLKDMTKSTEKSYIVAVGSKKLVLEVENRKKARRIARRKYAQEYRVDHSYVIVSGDTFKDAMLSLKKEITLRTTSKTKTTDKIKAIKTKKQVVKKAKTTKLTAKSITKKPETMLEDLMNEESKSLARLNKGNAKK